MFYYIEGIVAKTAKNLAVIDVNGVGYCCLTSQNTISSIKEGKIAKLYTYLYVREDIFDLYGFFEEEELECFKLLIGISGVGPKAALSILSVASPSKIAVAVLTDDEKLFLQAQGIGKKIAQRIIIELRDKMSKEQLENVGMGTVNYADGGGKTTETGEAISALVSLGYSRMEALKAMEGMDPNIVSAEDIIKFCLKKLAF